MILSKRGEILIFPNLIELAEAAAWRFVDLANEAIKHQGRFSVALSGGNTPRAIHKLLANPPLRDKIAWRKVNVFWGDERFVPPDDSENNFRMAQETLLDHLAIPAQNIHPIPTEGLTPEEAAASYSKTLRNFFAADLPNFNLVLLGMGADGHTASLFPGHSEVNTPGNPLVSVVKDAPKPPPFRITLTLKSINRAANVIFLVTGSDKAEAVKSVIEGTHHLPAGRIQPEAGKLLWFLDESAARYLKG